MKRPKESTKEKRYHAARNALDESMMKIRGVLGLITTFATKEQFADVEGACWLLYDELERLDDSVSDVVIAMEANP